jgi:2-hydroxycyclohexanecarboxyl-CoA dehydrogenase
VSSVPFPIVKTAVVTGVGSERGIGRDLAWRLGRAGWALGLIDLDQRGLDALTKEIHGDGAAVVSAAADISDTAALAVAARRFEAELPPVVAVINIAGISDPTPFLDTSLERWERVLRINLTGTFVVTRCFVPGMLARGVGRIVSLSSTAAQSGGGTYSAAAYAASKAGIEGMTRALAIEVAGKGVTANAIAPAIIDTDIMGGRIDESRMSYFTSRLPVGRLGAVSEVSALIEFLIGPEAGYITGATYNINGGARIG